MKTVTLYRPTGPNELELVKLSGNKRWPPRLPGQPIFYPVLNEEYATLITRNWNVRDGGLFDLLAKVWGRVLLDALPIFLSQK